MIRRLRGEFIRIAMLAVSLVLLLLTVSEIGRAHV